MIELKSNTLVVSFPELKFRPTLAINFQRTLRIPDDGKHYPLPPGLGSFPLRHIDDYAERVPEGWLKRGGVPLPMSLKTVKEKTEEKRAAPLTGNESVAVSNIVNLRAGLLKNQVRESDFVS